MTADTLALEAADVHQKVTNALGDEDGVYALCGFDFLELAHALNLLEISHVWVFILHQ